METTVNFRDAIPSSGKYLCWLFLGIVLLFVLFVRVRLLTVPLERDEGEYAYCGQLLLKGYPPFDKAYNMKFPGASMMYALSMLVFGQTTVGIHIGLLFINVATILLLFAAIRRVFNELVASVAAAVFALLSLSPMLLGTAAHATHFVLLYAMAGFVVMQRALAKDKTPLLWVSGILLGMSIIMKQSGAMFALLALAIVWYHQRVEMEKTFIHSLKTAAKVFVGIMLPVGALFFWMYAAGVFDRFWFWTVQYGSEYAGITSWAEGATNLKMFFMLSFQEYRELWLLALLGALGMWFVGLSRSKKLLVIAAAVFSFLAICPDLNFRGHYFVLFAPTVGLCAGFGAESVRRLITTSLKARRQSWIAPLVIIVAALPGIIRLHLYHFQYTPQLVGEELYPGNPVSESVLVAEYVRQHTTRDDNVAVLGSEPELCFYADRLSASGFLYTYSLMEPQRFNTMMQAEMINEIEKSNPAMLVYYRVKASWLARQESPTEIFRWLERYTRNGYYLTGMVVLPTKEGAAQYFWDEDARRHPPPTGDAIFIFGRKENRGRSQLP